MIPFVIVNPAPAGRIIFPGIKWTSSVNKALITIDDSPNPGTTPLTLKILDKLNIHALFFCIGKNMAANPGLMNEIISAGHSVGNHTYNHINIRKISSETLADEIKRTSEEFEKHGIKNTKYFRPPYGRFNTAALRIAGKQGLKTVLWSLLTYDYNNDLKLFKFAAKKIRNNSIVVMHDSLKSKSVLYDGLTFLCETAAAKNITIGRPEECLK